MLKLDGREIERVYLGDSLVHTMFLGVQRVWGLRGNQATLRTTTLNLRMGNAFLVGELIPTYALDTMTLLIGISETALADVYPLESMMLNMSMGEIELVKKIQLDTITLEVSMGEMYIPSVYIMQGITYEISMGELLYSRVYSLDTMTLEMSIGDADYRLSYPLDGVTFEITMGDVVYGTAESPLSYMRWTNPYSRGNRSALITVTSNISMGAGSVQALVDGTESNSNWFGTGQSSRQIKFQFVDPQQIAAVMIRQNGIGGQGDWIARVSNDDVIYIDASDTFTWGLTAITIIELFEPGYFEYLVLDQVANVTSSGPYVNEIRFCTGSESDTPPTASPADYANIGGSGNRQMEVPMILHPYGVAGGGANALVNGNTSDNSGYYNGGGSGGRMVITFGQPVRIEEFKWYQNAAMSQGDWQWQYYELSSDSWINVGSPFTLGGSMTTTNNDCAGEPGFHGTWALNHVSGFSNSGPYVREVEFKVATNGV